ncbi:DnaJ domain-containing protein [Aliarcobacter cryaerophilus]|uniref:DnaJ domain-containing protein n=1 Tax=Aliarcobacter cryaerophilus TaxID=28198 RepID=UPI0021B4F930|nr:DnaJ domain-containing protein [Aliarcobacter cryaerophilus]MCT7539571.1 DnaJ domain-containing protein [Aliarcobacter cryaerophilus]
MRNILLLLSVFFCFNLELKAESFRLLPLYKTSFNIDDTLTTKNDVIDNFLKEDSIEKKIEYIRQYIKEEEDLKELFKSLEKINRDKKQDISFLLMEYKDKFNFSRWNRGSIYSFVNATKVTKADDISNVLLAFKNNKNFDFKYIYFGKNLFSFDIYDLIDANNYTEINKIYKVLMNNNLDLYVLSHSIREYYTYKVNKLWGDSFNKKRLDLSDLAKKNDEFLFNVVTFLRENNIKEKIIYDKGYEHLATLPRVLREDFFKEFSDKTQKALLAYYIIDSKDLETLNDYYGSNYNFKSLKGYLEFIAYSEYNWIFATLIILYIFLESRKIILTRLYNKEKNELILSSRDFFYENKIEKNEILPIKLIIDKYKLYNSLVENYDKLYIKSLKLGLYNKANKNKLTNLKREITSLEKDIKILKEELINLEQKFQTKELQNLINIKTRIEKLKDSTTFAYILDNVIKVQNEINELLENYTDDKFSDVKIKEIESFIQKLEKELKESSIYLEEYNKLITLSNPYDILGVNNKDDISVIKKKWKELCIKYHSDKNIDKPQYVKDIYEETIKIINNAWDIISKQDKKVI